MVGTSKIKPRRIFLNFLFSKNVIIFQSLCNLAKIFVSYNFFRKYIIAYMDYFNLEAFFKISVLVLLSCKSIPLRIFVNFRQIPRSFCERFLKNCIENEQWNVSWKAAAKIFEVQARNKNKNKTLCFSSFFTTKLNKKEYIYGKI